MRSIKNIVFYLIISLLTYVFVMFLLVRITWNDMPLVYSMSKNLNWKGGHTYRNFQEFDPNQKYDIIFLGSSRAYKGYNPELFEGMNTWNLGTSNQNIEGSYIILKHYLDSSNCKRLLLDLWFESFMGDGKESTSNLISNLNDDQAALDMALRQKEVASINNWLIRAFSKSYSSFYEEKNYKSKGFVTDTLEFSEDGIVGFNGRIAHYFKPDRKYRNILKDIVALAKERGIEISFCISPTSLSYEKFIHEQFLSYINRIVEDNGIELWDCSQVIEDKRRFFMDDAHLNEEGVKIFNQHVIDHYINR